MVIDSKPAEDGKKSNLTKIVLQLVGGGAFGFSFMLGLDYVVGLDTLFDKLSGAEIIAFTFAVIYMMIALIVLAMSASRRFFMTNHRHEGTSETEFADVKPMLRWSAICLMIYAAALALMALAGQVATEQKMLVFAGVVVAMIAQSAISLHLWKRYDELYRGVTRESCAAAFVISEILLFIWAAVALCGLPITFDPLAVIVAITGIYWAASIWYISKRGMV
jgi:hypothetical protein